MLQDRDNAPTSPGEMAGSQEWTEIAAARSGALIRLWRGERMLIYFVLPAMIFMALVYLYPLGILVFQSFHTMAGAFTLSGYKVIALNGLFRVVLFNTIKISFMATVATLLLAYPVAYHLANQGPRVRSLLMVLVLLPFWTSVLVKSFAFTVVLGNSGIISSLVARILGMDHPPQLLFNRIGVIIGLTNYFIPFMVFPILTSLLAQDRDLLKAARLMGAGSIRIFWRITFPLSMPGVLAGCLLTFALSLAFFIIPMVIGGPKDLMLANLIDLYTRQTLNWTLAASISMVLFVLSLGLIFALSRIPGGRSVYEVRQ